MSRIAARFQAVPVGAGLGAVNGIGENPIVAANPEGANGAFDGIVVEVQPPVFAIDGERCPMRARYAKALPIRPLGKTWVIRLRRATDDQLVAELADFNILDHINRRITP